MEQGNKKAIQKAYIWQQGTMKRKKTGTSNGEAVIKRKKGNDEYIQFDATYR